MSAYITGGKRKSSQTHARRAMWCLCGKLCRGNGGISSHRKTCPLFGKTPLGYRPPAA